MLCTCVHICMCIGIFTYVVSVEGTHENGKGLEFVLFLET